MTFRYNRSGYNVMLRFPFHLVRANGKHPKRIVLRTSELGMVFKLFKDVFEN